MAGYFIYRVQIKIPQGKYLTSPVKLSTFQHPAFHTDLLILLLLQNISSSSIRKLVTIYALAFNFFFWGGDLPFPKRSQPCGQPLPISSARKEGENEQKHFLIIRSLMSQTNDSRQVAKKLYDLTFSQKYFRQKNCRIGELFSQFPFLFWRSDIKKLFVFMSTVKLQIVLFCL